MTWAGTPSESSVVVRTGSPMRGASDALTPHLRCRRAPAIRRRTTKPRTARETGEEKPGSTTNRGQGKAPLGTTGCERGAEHWANTTRRRRGGSARRDMAIPLAPLPPLGPRASFHSTRGVLCREARSRVRSSRKRHQAGSGPTWASTMMAPRVRGSMQRTESTSEASSMPASPSPLPSSPPPA